MNRIWKAILGATALGLVVAGAVAWRGHGVAEDTIPVEQMPLARYIADLRKGDPALGSALPSLGTPDKRPTLVLYVGDCTKCVGKRLPELAAFAKRHANVRFLALASLSEEKTKAQRAALPFPVISDEAGEKRRAYNAAWAIRAYLLDSDGRLLWKQDDWAFNVAEVEKKLPG